MGADLSRPPGVARRRPPFTSRDQSQRRYRRAGASFTCVLWHLARHVFVDTGQALLVAVLPGDDFRFRHLCGVEYRSDYEGWEPTDATIATLAQRQYGVVARWQLVERGIGRGAIHARLRRGSLHLVH